MIPNQKVRLVNKNMFQEDVFAWTKNMQSVFVQGTQDEETFVDTCLAECDERKCDGVLHDRKKQRCKLALKNETNILKAYDAPPQIEDSAFVPNLSYIHVHKYIEGQQNVNFETIGNKKMMKRELNAFQESIETNTTFEACLSICKNFEDEKCLAFDFEYEKANDDKINLKNQIGSCRFLFENEENKDFDFYKKKY